jgi:outer membrane protein assembly factor BamB
MHMVRAILLAALLSLALAATAGAATITPSKRSTPPLTTITVSGVGFAPGERVDIAFDGHLDETVTASSKGAFANVSVGVPDVPPGTYRVTATGRTSGITDAARILVHTPWTMFRGGPTHIGVNFFERTLGVNEVGGLHLACAGSRWPATASYSSPAVWSGLAIVGTTDSNVIAFDSQSCAGRWVAPTGSVVYSSPAIGEGRVVVGTLDGGVLAFDGHTGDRLWHDPLPGSFFGSATISGGVAFIASQDGRVYALDIHTGAVRWSAKPSGNSGVGGSPAVAGGRVFVGDAGGGGHMRAYRATDGKLLWTVRNTGMIAGSAAVHDGVVFIGGGATLHALRASTGSRIWAAPAGPALLASSPAVANGFVFVRTRDRTLRGFDEDSGVQLIAQTMGGDDPEAGNAIAYASPVVANGVLYVPSSDERLYAFDANDGSFLNSVSTFGEVWGSPAVSDGRVWVSAVNTSCAVCSFAGTPAP